MTPPEIALIIPSLSGQVEQLLASIRHQTLQPAELVVVHGVSPNGRARNQGVAQTRAPVLVFVDDDAVLGDQHTLANLVAPLLADPTIGVTGASKLLPPDAPWFQRWVARELPRIVHPVVSTLLETNPDPPSFYSEITTTCCAMRRTVFLAAGGFDEHLLRGVDTEFFVRVRQLAVRRPATADKRQETADKRQETADSSQSLQGDPQSPIPNPRSPIPGHYRFLLVPNTWAYHPAPASLRALLRKQFYYGAGHAQEVRRDPRRARGRALTTPLHAVAYLLFRSAILLPNVFLPYSFAAPSWRPGFKPLKALASYISALGYVWGWYYAPHGKTH